MQQAGNAMQHCPSVTTPSAKLNTSKHIMSLRFQEVDAQGVESTAQGVEKADVTS